MTSSILTIIRQQDDEYDRLHALYEEAKQRIDSATTPEELATATTAFHPIQQAFLQNREQAVPTECYQIIASYLDRQSRARLAECDKHLHYQVIYGKCSGRFVWSEGAPTLQQHMYRRTYEEYPKKLIMAPLHHACREGTSRVVRVLIEGKADLEAIDGGGDERRTALHWACREGHEEVAGLLIAAGANLNTLDGHRWSPLYYAVNANSLPIVRRLLLTASVNANDGLYPAARNNNGEMVNVLLEAKADANYINNGGETPLHSAVFHNAANVIPILIVGGANINHRGYHNCLTPLALACLRQRMDAINVLLIANADPNIVDNTGRSPLMFASRDGNVDILRALLVANANVHLVANGGDTALRWAKRKKREEMIGLLLAAGAIDE